MLFFIFAGWLPPSRGRDATLLRLHERQLHASLDGIKTIQIRVGQSKTGVFLPSIVYFKVLINWWWIKFGIKLFFNITSHYRNYHKVQNLIRNFNICCMVVKLWNHVVFCSDTFNQWCSPIRANLKRDCRSKSEL